MPQIADQVAVASNAPSKSGRRLAGPLKVSLNGSEEFRFGEHRGLRNSPFPRPTQGTFLRAPLVKGIIVPPQAGTGMEGTGMPSEMDSVRAIIIARIEQLGTSFTVVSKKIGANPAYLQQFIRRGIPAVLPEDKRERLAQVLGVSANALRGGKAGRGGPRAVPADAVAQTDQEVEMLRLFRSMDATKQTQALGVLRALS